MKKFNNLKRFLSMLLSISMVVGLVAVVEPREAAAATGTNLVTNSGFDTTDGWDGAVAQEKVQDVEIVKTAVFEAGFEPSEGKAQVQPWLAGEKATLDTANVYGDGSTQSLKWNTSDSTILEFMPFQVEAGKTYNVSYDWKVEDGVSGPFYCRFHQYLDQSEVLWDAPVGWNHVEYETTATSSGDVILYIEANSGTVYVDNVSVAIITEVPKTATTENKVFD